MKRSEKHELVDLMKVELAKAQSAVVADYRGLTVAQITDLRDRCRGAGVKIKVIKNTLLNLAARETDKAGLEKFIVGPTVLAWHDEDPGAPARIFTAFAKEKGNEALEIKGGVASGQAMGANEVKFVLATLPTREELLAQCAALFNAGPAKLGRVLAAGPNMLGRVLHGLKEKKEAA